MNASTTQNSKKCKALQWSLVKVVGWQTTEYFSRKALRSWILQYPILICLLKKFDKDAPDPKFNGNWAQKLEQYSEGLTSIWSGQCPYPSNYAEELAETAEKEFNVAASLVELKTCEEAQNSACPFGVFCVVYNGKVVAGTPISKGRLCNILKKELKQK